MILIIRSSFCYISFWCHLAFFSLKSFALFRIPFYSSCLSFITTSPYYLLLLLLIILLLLLTTVTMMFTYNNIMTSFPLIFMPATSQFFSFDLRKSYKKLFSWIFYSKCSLEMLFLLKVLNYLFLL